MSATGQLRRGVDDSGAFATGADAFGGGEPKRERFAPAADGNGTQLSLAGVVVGPDGILFGPDNKPILGPDGKPRTVASLGENSEGKSSASMGFHLFARHDEHGNPIDEHGNRIALDEHGKPRVMLEGDLDSRKATVGSPSVGSSATVSDKDGKGAARVSSDGGGKKGPGWGARGSVSSGEDGDARLSVNSGKKGRDWGREQDFF